MKIVTHAEARKLSTETLFNKGGTATKTMKYCNGKYEWTGSVNDYVGKEIENVASDILAVYVERRRNVDGAYAQLMCITY